MGFGLESLFLDLLTMQSVALSPDCSEAFWIVLLLAFVPSLRTLPPLSLDVVFLGFGECALTVSCIPST